MVERGPEIAGVEVKSGATVPLEMFAPLEAAARLIPELRTSIVLHGGPESFTTSRGRALSYREIDGVDWVRGP
jgi:hypothetical protein